MSDDHAAKLRRAVTQAGKLAAQGSESFTACSIEFGVFACAVTGLSEVEIAQLADIVNGSQRRKTDRTSRNLDNLSGARAE